MGRGPAAATGPSRDGPRPPAWRVGLVRVYRYRGFEDVRVGLHHRLSKTFSMFYFGWSVRVIGSDFSECRMSLNRVGVQDFRGTGLGVWFRGPGKRPRSGV